MGCAVTTAGDWDGDGLDDLLTGSGWADAPTADTGEIFVVFGRRTLPGASLRLDTLNGTNGFAVYGDRTADFCGWSVGGAGDVNGDGAGDVIIGACQATAAGRYRAGLTYVVYGKPHIDLRPYVTAVSPSGTFDLPPGGETSIVVRADAGYLIGSLTTNGVEIAVRLAWNGHTGRGTGWMSRRTPPWRRTPGGASASQMPVSKAVWTARTLCHTASGALSSTGCTSAARDVCASRRSCRGSLVPYGSTT